MYSETLCLTCGSDPCGGCSSCTEADDLRRELHTAFWTCDEGVTVRDFQGKYKVKYDRLLKLENIARNRAPKNASQQKDYAAVALLGMLSHPTRYRPRDEDKFRHWHDAIAKEAFDIAEAMADEAIRRGLSGGD